MHVNQKMDSAFPDKFLKYVCAIKQTSSEIWRYRTRLPEWSRQEEKRQVWLSAKGVDEEETQRELSTNEEKSQWSHSPSLTSPSLTATPQNGKIKGSFTRKTEPCKPSSELTFAFILTQGPVFPLLLETEEERKAEKHRWEHQLVA